MLQQLLQKHPEWTQQELANWTGRAIGWVKKWAKRLREAPPDDASVLFGKPFGRKTPYPQTDPAVEACILAIRDTPPENLKRTPGPRAILYYLSSGDKSLWIEEFGSIIIVRIALACPNR